MASSARTDEIKKKFDENPRRYFAPLANEFRKAGDLEQAILICEEFLPQQAGHMSGHIVYGQALYEAGRLPESRTVFETALGLDPENLIALRHLGDIARAQGDLMEARRWYDRVLEADPRNDEIQGLLAMLDAAEGTAPAPAPAEQPAPWESQASAPTVAMEAIDLSSPVPEPRHEPAAELAPIDLDLDDAVFGAPAPASEPAPPAPSAHAASFESIALDDMEPTNAGAETAAGMPVTPLARAEGLETSEFEAPAPTHQRAEGLEPSEFEMPTEAPPRAEGLETSEFEVPAGVEANALPDLESSFAAEVGTSDAAAGIGGAPLPGLEEAGAAHPPAADEPVLPSLDLDEGLAVPAHGTVEPVGAPTPVVADVPLGEAAGPGAGDPRMEPPAAMEAMPALELDGLPFDAPSAEPPVAGDAGGAAPMLELTPEVIAAESALMDSGEVLDEAGYVQPSAPVQETGYAGDTGYEEDAGYVAAGGAAPFVTETMAELYLKQGFNAQALDVYRQLRSASPHDERLRQRVAELEAAAEATPEPAAPAAEPAGNGPTVREFFFRLATRRPGELSGHEAPQSYGDVAAPSASASPADDFGGFDTVMTGETEASVGLVPDQPAAPPVPVTPPSSSPALDFLYEPEPEEPVAPAPRETPPAPPAASAMPSAVERAASALGGPKGGTIDALFGTRPSSGTEDSAASALAQAFGGATEAPAISGRPARAATGELSLDSVFRDGPARPPRVSQNFSFDQFFSESATTESGESQAPSEGAAASEPAERTADDVKQFNSWLQGLKPR